MIKIPRNPGDEFGVLVPKVTFFCACILLQVFGLTKCQSFRNKKAQRKKLGGNEGTW